MFMQFLLTFILIFGPAEFALSQPKFSNEIGIIAGPVSFQSDYGERLDSGPFIGKTGFGIGLIHYVNLSYIGYNNYKPETYFDEHFKLRTEISFTKSQFKHYGSLIDNNRKTTSLEQLRAMRGETDIINIGLQMEYYLINVHDFENTTSSLNPYISLGAHYSFFNPKAYSLLGPLEDNTSLKFKTATSNKSSSIMSIVASAGSRYKLNEISDLIIESKMQYYFSDWVDGLNPNPTIHPENKANDWLVWLNVGYIYYLNQ